jgi:hypothetical protein
MTQLATLRIHLIVRKVCRRASLILICVFFLVASAQNLQSPLPGQSVSYNIRQLQRPVGGRRQLPRAAPNEMPVPPNLQAGSRIAKRQATAVAAEERLFLDTPQYDTGVYPVSVAVGDFNGDGKPDLAVANAHDSSVSALLGNGDGSFQTHVDYATGGLPLSVAVGDFNGDGKPDLAVTNYNGDSVSVLLGNGDGSFQTHVDYGTGTGTGPYSVAVGDFNGDGKPDLAVTNSEDNSVSVLTNSDDNSVSVLLGNGDGSFQTSMNYARGQGHGAVTVGDFNRDGAPDLAVLTPGNALTVLLNIRVITADFTLTSSPASGTVTAGHPGTFTLTLTPQGSFNSPIGFSCSGLPALAGCTFSPASVTPNSSTVTSMLTITTTAHTASLASPFGRRRSPLYAIWLVLPAMLLGTAGMAAPKRRKLLSCCVGLLLVGGCLLQAACGSGSPGSGGGGGGGGTPPGTYTVTVTGVAGSTQHKTTVTLAVQ